MASKSGLECLLQIAINKRKSLDEEIREIDKSIESIIIAIDEKRGEATDETDK